jgi:hypothetical protein
MTTSHLRQTWQRLLHVTAERITLMGAAEQTRLSWAKSVKTVDEIPEFYRAYIQDHLPGLDACLPAVLTPTFRGFLRRENEKLVFTQGERLFILEQTSTGLLPVVFPFADINYIEVGGILLKAWVRVNGLIDGELVTATLKYNSVTQYLFDPLVGQIREALTDMAPTADLHQEQAKFDPLRDGHFKFMNYARRSLQAGERVVAYTIQPELRQPRLTVLGKPLALHTLETAHMCILTDAELIIIRDDPSSLKDYNQTRYGGIWDYIPLSQVQSAAIEERPAGHLALVIHLPGGDRIEVLFSTEKRLELEQLCTRLEAITPTQ